MNLSFRIENDRNRGTSFIFGPVKSDKDNSRGKCKETTLQVDDLVIRRRVVVMNTSSRAMLGSNDHCPLPVGLLPISLLSVQRFPRRDTIRIQELYRFAILSSHACAVDCLRNACSQNCSVELNNQQSTLINDYCPRFVSRRDILHYCFVRLNLATIEL